MAHHYYIRMRMIKQSITNLVTNLWNINRSHHINIAWFNSSQIKY